MVGSAVYKLLKKKGFIIIDCKRNSLDLTSQIEINKLICTNYAKSLLNTEIDDLHKASLAITNESNLNEVTIVSKKMTKLGFFEKLFHIFS